MPSPKVSALTKKDIASAASKFRWNRQMPKWSVIVDGRELPARPLVLDAAGVPPNDPTNSHQAVAILKQYGFDVRYQGKAIQEGAPEPTNREIAEMEDLLRRIRGSCKARESLVEVREREHRDDRY